MVEVKSMMSAVQENDAQVFLDVAGLMKLFGKSRTTIQRMRKRAGFPEAVYPTGFTASPMFDKKAVCDWVMAQTKENAKK